MTGTKGVQYSYAYNFPFIVSNTTTIATTPVKRFIRPNHHARTEPDHKKQPYLSPVTESSPIGRRLDCILPTVQTPYIPASHHSLSAQLLLAADFTAAALAEAKETMRLRYETQQEAPSIKPDKVSPQPMDGEEQALHHVSLTHQGRPVCPFGLCHPHRAPTYHTCKYEPT